MAQGVEWNKEEVIELLMPFFKKGCSVTKACSYAGIPQSTVATWINDDEVLRLKIGIWQNEPNDMARSVWIAKIAEGDFQAAEKWMSKREKDEFSDRQELTSANGENLPTPIISLNGLPGNNGNAQNSGT